MEHPIKTSEVYYISNNRTNAYVKEIDKDTLILTDKIDLIKTLNKNGFFERANEIKEEVIKHLNKL